MEPYQAFAGVYDRIMDEIPYREWCSYVTGLLSEYQIKDGLLLELGCGTGTLTELFAQKGFDLIGVDNSAEMLQAALEKRDKSSLPILYLCQDMRAFELYGTVRAAVSLCDTMNYLTDYDDLVRVLRLVNNYLDPGGIFIFDLKTEYYFREVVGDATFADPDDEISYIWQNEYDPENNHNQYLLTLFLQEADGRYARYDELHDQRAWSLAEIRQAAADAGMVFLHAFDESHDNVNEKTERYYIILQEQGKQQ